MIKEKYERKNLFLKQELVEVLDFLVYKKKTSLREIVNSLIEKGIKEEFKEDPNILLQLTLENTEKEEEEWLLKELSSLTPKERNPSLKVTFDEKTKEWKEEVL